MTTENFYKKLKKHNMPLHKLLDDGSLFSRVPANWFVVVADIEDSTKAVKNGLHDSVNLAATGSIIVVLNEIKRINKTFKIPYFFGGDGATFLIPPQLIDSVISILQRYTAHIKKTLYLTLRAGKIPVSQVYKNGHNLKISKLKLNPYLVTPVVLGLGLKYAERFIKESFKTSFIKTTGNLSVDLNGMECRWDEILPESSENKIVCLIVNAADEYQQSEVFSEILREIYVIFGPLDERLPITTKRLKLNTTVNKIKREMNARIGSFKLGYLLKNWAITFFGKFYFKFFKEGKQYLFKVSQLSDTLMIDGSINTVMSGSNEQISTLILVLERLESEGKINYGLHETYASIMSCYVEDRKNNHIHFVDGTEGGYTSAAKILKKKLASL